ncbi:MAG: hypothetical protein MUF13_11660 [Akkermansiaceae bacterium]|jgi:hypothetical protein|nr:hypothetical protein [Akkermansiaceae bacterium]
MMRSLHALAILVANLVASQNKGTGRRIQWRITLGFESGIPTSTSGRTQTDLLAQRALFPALEVAGTGLTEQGVFFIGEWGGFLYGAAPRGGIYGNQRT